MLRNNKEAWGNNRTLPTMLIGYARVSPVDQNLTAQREALLELGVDVDLLFVDHGFSAAN